MKTLIKILPLLLSFIILISCNDKSVETITEQIKDPRDMTWTADTLKMPDTAIQLLPEDLLVVSPKDIWLAVWVGHGQLWHYNGSSWTVVEDIGGGIDCLLKKSDTDLWAGGYKGRLDGDNAAVANYKNGAWTWNEMAIKSEILDMCTDGDGNVWACGRNGLVMKYSNNKWTADTINIKPVNNYSYLFVGIKNYNGKINVVGAMINKSTYIQTHYYISGNIKNWTVQDSMVFNSASVNIKFGNWGLHKSDDNYLYSYGLQGIWKYENNQWQQIYYLDGEMYGMYCTNSNYIIAVSAFNQVFFYNGSNWQLISDIFKTNDPYFVFSHVTIVDKEIYVAGYGTINNKDAVILWHGK
jgi:hypothetical protein